jgi:MFS family permease
VTLIKYPGFYLISFWYKPHESQKRFTFFWTSVMFAGACGGFLASAIAKMDGIAGLQNWRWIFILEGLGTVTLGVVSYFFIVDFPESASWLSEKERAFILERTARCNSKEAHASITATDVVLFFKSPRLILGAMMYFGTYGLLVV